MAFSHTTNGATDRGSIFRGDVGFVSGTWTSVSETSGTISTGMSTILAHDVTVGSAFTGGPGTAGGSAMILHAKNQTGGGNSKAGLIRVSSMDDGNTMSGDWWAVARL